MDIVLTRLSPKMQAIINIITSILGAFICLLLTWYGTQVTWEHFREGLSTETALRLPMVYLLAIIPAGSFLLFIQFLRRAYGFSESLRLSANKQQRLWSDI